MTSPPTLRHLAEAATPGPWEAGNAGSNRRSVYNVSHADGLAEGVLAQCKFRDAEANAAYIAAANPTAVLALLDQLEQATARLKRFQEAQEMDKPLIQKWETT